VTGHFPEARFKRHKPENGKPGSDQLKPLKLIDKWVLAGSKDGLIAPFHARNEA